MHIMVVVNGNSSNIDKKLHKLTFKYFFTFSMNIGGTQGEILGIHREESCQAICWFSFSITNIWLDGFEECFNCAVGIGLDSLLWCADEVEACESFCQANLGGPSVLISSTWSEILGIGILEGLILCWGATALDSLYLV